MTLIGILTFAWSLVSISSFAAYHADKDIPFLYNYGAWLAYFWFHDQNLCPTRGVGGVSEPDDPPTQTCYGEDGSIEAWPQNTVLYNSPKYNLYMQNDTKNTTNVRGYGGIPENSRNAYDPNQYIMNRLYGKQFGYGSTDVYSLQEGNIWNRTKDFKDFSPQQTTYDSLYDGLGDVIDSNADTWKKTYVQQAPSNRQGAIDIVQPPYLPLVTKRGLNAQLGGMINLRGNTYGPGAPDPRSNVYVQSLTNEPGSNNRNSNEGSDPWSKYMQMVSVPRSPHWPLTSHNKPVTHGGIDKVAAFWGLDGASSLMTIPHFQTPAPPVYYSGTKIVSDPNATQQFIGWGDSVKVGDIYPKYNKAEVPQTYHPVDNWPSLTFIKANLSSKLVPVDVV